MKGKVVVITGASRGIGAAAMRAFVAAGAQGIVHAGLGNANTPTAYRAFIGRLARCMPASTIRNSPVMFDALARKNSTASAICSGVPAWRSGFVTAIDVRAHGLAGVALGWWQGGHAWRHTAFRLDAAHQK